MALSPVVNRWGNHMVNGEEAYWLVLYRTHRHNDDTSLEVEHVGDKAVNAEDQTTFCYD